MNTVIETISGKLGRMSPGKRHAIYASVLFLVSVLLYWGSLGNEFVWDAEGAFRDDVSIRDLRNIPFFFAKAYAIVPREEIERGGVSVRDLVYYRPLVKTLHAVEYWFFGADPLGYNIVNIALNGLVVALAFSVTLGVTGDARTSFLASLLYAVNPTRTEVVCWAYSDSHILAALFALLSFSLYRRGRHMWALLVYGMALFSQENVVLLPLLFVLHDFLVRGKRSPGDYLPIAPFFIILAAFLLLRRGVAGATPLSGLDPFSLFNAVAVIARMHLKIFFVPDGPITVYEYRAGMFSSVDAGIVLSYFVAGAVAVFGLFLWARRRSLLFWLLWFFVLTAHWFNAGAFGEYLISEKTLYLASLGVSVLISSFALGAVRNRPLVLALSAALVLYHSALTVGRGEYWKDTVTYLEEAARFAPDFPLIHLSLANSYAARGDYDRAVSEYRSAGRLRPAMMPMIDEAIGGLYFRRGNDYALAGDYRAALGEYERALPLARNRSILYNNIGNAHVSLGEAARAVSAWEKAVAADPSNAEPYYNIALVLEREGSFPRSLEFYRKFIELSPGLAPQLSNKIRELEAKAGRGGVSR